ncbi:tetratricopeptide repeat protein [Niabella ginsengisoli]|uniref:Tetratricopeptide repeat protein n=1 Tax=Niabella ginsengisoli TaxID=522298 RepID=A0ABS9SFG0_9BACT|nr:tetratricopeptide repeat protein [Niabella ginsengisoli]MCH5597070.1 tetratricopeptide repeat protein [Niabella ginsengisoli]
MNKFLLLLSLLLCSIHLCSQNNYNKGVGYRNRGVYDTALYYFNAALKHQQQLKDSFQPIRVVLERGKTYQLSEKYDLALADFLHALSLGKQLKDNNCIMKSYIYLAEFYRHLGKYTEAQKYLNLAEKLETHSTISYQTKAQFYNRKAAILTEILSDREEIIDLSQKAIEISQKYGYPDIEVSSLNQLGYLFSGDATALNYYKKALAVLKKHQDVRTEVDILINTSRFYQLSGGPYNEGIKYADKGLKLCAGKKWHYASKELHHIKAACYHALGNIKKANEELVYVLEYTEKHLASQYEKNCWMQKPNTR